MAEEWEFNVLAQSTLPSGDDIEAVAQANRERQASEIARELLLPVRRGQWFLAFSCNQTLIRD
jgi:hypothetical protein